MPEYFFHVAIEVFTDPVAKTPSTESLQTPRVSHIFQVLKPFTNSKSRRSSRDHSYDRKPFPGDHNKSKQKLTTPTPPTAEHVPSAYNDPRLDKIYVDSANMNSKAEMEETVKIKENIVGKGIGTAISGQHTKGHYTPITQDQGDAGWGVVHLYRDAEETPGLYKDATTNSLDLWNTTAYKQSLHAPHPAPKDEECTSVCILAVPSYMTPFDFLAFVGEDTRSKVSHFRMVRTARANRYMVLMKFKHGKQAREWQNEWNGKIFNSMEPETCHVVFLKSVEIVHSTLPADGLTTPTEGFSYPRMTNDPFMPPSATTRPVAPRTPSLVELPTCPVCLERMDETTGLLTILCQHVFHCTCLQKWSGGGCPVCRYTHDDFSSRLGSYKHSGKLPGEYEVSDKPLECETCHADSNLWQCLICGKVGCGRYEGKHAYAHFEETGHTFSMDLESKRVWDYAGDGYVHRIIQDAAKPGEKLVELPGRRREPTALEGQDDLELAKMDNVALEYTHLLTSQLESQRVYFEEIVERAADKASEATRRAEKAVEEGKLASETLAALETQHDFVAKGRVPELEKEKDRLERRLAKFEEIAKSVNSKYLEEKSVASNLLQRIRYLEETQISGLTRQIQQLQDENATKDLLMEGLREEHRDAMMQVSASRKLQEMVANGELDPEDLQGASITAGPPKMTPRERLKARLQKSQGNRSAIKPSKSSRPDTLDRTRPVAPSTNADTKSISPANETDEADSLDVSELFEALVACQSIQNNNRALQILDDCRQKLFDAELLRVEVKKEASDILCDNPEPDGQTIAPTAQGIAKVPEEEAKSSTNNKNNTSTQKKGKTRR